MAFNPQKIADASRGDLVGPAWEGVLVCAGARAILEEMLAEIEGNVEANPQSVTTGPMLVKYIERKIDMVDQETEG